MPTETLPRRLKNGAIHCASRLLPTGSLARRRLRDSALVLAFHRVNDRSAGDGLTLSARDFDAYCRFLGDHLEVVHLKDIVENLEASKPLRGQLAITFDDGYRDNFEEAAPILERYGLPATFFVTTDFIETETVAPWDRDLSEAPGWMTWEQVRSLLRRGFAIGAHTMSHIDLGQASANDARAQIAGSQDVLREQLDTQIDLFAYPFGQRGNITEDNRALVRDAGFRCCASCFGGIVEANTDPMRLPRTAVSSWYASPRRLALDLALGRL
jgi:peptidoglycan/xylan/chitin deacetylase (PgdA/CDA1 family)